MVLLLPFQDIQHPPSWITEKFRVSPGGKHEMALLRTS